MMGIGDSICVFAVSRAVHQEQAASTIAQTLHAAFPLDSCHPRGAEIWVPAAVPAGLNCILHANSSSFRPNSSQSFWSGNGEDLLPSECLLVIEYAPELHALWNDHPANTGSCSQLGLVQESMSTFEFILLTARLTKTTTHPAKEHHTIGAGRGCCTPLCIDVCSTSVHSQWATVGHNSHAALSTDGIDMMHAADWSC